MTACSCSCHPHTQWGIDGTDVQVQEHPACDCVCCSRPPVMTQGNHVAPATSVGVTPDGSAEVAVVQGSLSPVEGGGDPGQDDGVEQVDPLDIPDHYDLPMYGSITACPKCNNERVNTEYHAAGVLSAPCGKRFGWPQIQNLGEHLCRTCNICKYGWPEEVAHGAA